MICSLNTCGNSKSFESGKLPPDVSIKSATATGESAMPKKFKGLREKLSPAARERSRVLAAKYRAEMALDELREAHAMTQVHLARILGVNQAAVSKLERRTDMYVSTLQDFIKAMGGELKITARFPEGTVEISQFERVRKAAAGSE
jgi:hypothetical protein